MVAPVSVTFAPSSPVRPFPERRDGSAPGPKDPLLPGGAACGFNRRRLMTFLSAAPRSVLCERGAAIRPLITGRTGCDRTEGPFTSATLPLTGAATRHLIPPADPPTPYYSTTPLCPARLSPPPMTLPSASVRRGAKTLNSGNRRGWFICVLVKSAAVHCQATLTRHGCVTV